MQHLPVFVNEAAADYIKVMAAGRGEDSLGKEVAVSQNDLAEKTPKRASAWFLKAKRPQNHQE